MIKKWMISGILVLLFCYFFVHVFYGNRGLLVYYDLKKEVDVLRSNLDHLQDKEKKLEKRVKLLRPGSLDKDLLKEYVHKKLNLIAEREYLLKIP